MGSGIYSAVSGAVANAQRLDIVANNLANLNTPGFKGSRTTFAETLLGELEGADQPTSIVGLSSTSRDVAQGALRKTSSQLDLALEGKGYLAVENASGDRFYTRGGAFSVGPQRRIVDREGNTLLDRAGKPIHVPQRGDLQIATDGSVRNGGRPLAQLMVVEFADAAALQRRGDLLLSAPDDQAPDKATATRVHQGFLEAANINPVKGVSQMILASRAYEAFHRVISTYRRVDERMVRDIPSQR